MNWKCNFLTATIQNVKPAYKTLMIIIMTRLSRSAAETGAYVRKLNYKLVRERAHVLFLNEGFSANSAAWMCSNRFVPLVEEQLVITVRHSAVGVKKATHKNAFAEFFSVLLLKIGWGCLTRNLYSLVHSFWIPSQASKATLSPPYNAYLMAAKHNYYISFLWRVLQKTFFNTGEFLNNF